MFPFVVPFIDRVTGMELSGPMTGLHCIYFDLLLKLGWESMSNEKSERYLSDLGRYLKGFKQLFREIFHANCKDGLYMQRFYLLDHLVVDVDRIGSLCVGDSSSFERNNLHI